MKTDCSSSKSSPSSTGRRRKKKAGCSSAKNCFPNSTGRTRRRNYLRGCFHIPNAARCGWTRRTNCPDCPTRNSVPVRGWTTRCCRRRDGVCSLRSWWMCPAKGGSRPKGCGCRRRCLRGFPSPYPVSGRSWAPYRPSSGAEAARPAAAAFRHRDGWAGTHGATTRNHASTTGRSSTGVPNANPNPMGRGGTAGRTRPTDRTPTRYSTDRRRRSNCTATSSTVRRNR